MSNRFLGAAALSVGLIASAHAQSSTYAVDPTHTFVTFEAVRFDTSTLRGRFDRNEGSVTLDRAAQRGTADITIGLASLSTGVAPLDDQLKGKDFFDVGTPSRVPSARFVSDSFAFNGDKVSAVSGTLSMLGKSLPVTLTASHFNCYLNPLLRRETCGGDFETTIASSQWGMNFGIDSGLPDTIRLLIQIEAIKTH